MMPSHIPWGRRNNSTSSLWIMVLAIFIAPLAHGHTSGGAGIDRLKAGTRFLPEGSDRSSLSSMSEKTASRKWCLIPIAVILVMIVGLFDLIVVAPRRLAVEAEARRLSPSKVVRPSVLRARAQHDGSDAREEPERKILTAFRKEEWRQKKIPSVVMSDQANGR